MSETDYTQLAEDMVISEFIRCPLCLTSCDPSDNWRHHDTDAGTGAHKPVTVTWECGFCGMHCDQSISPDDPWLEDYNEFGYPHQPPTGSLATRAWHEGSLAFDGITGAAFYGMKFRGVLQNDPVALAAAKTLSDRLRRSGQFKDTFDLVGAKEK